jgi:hypothetical protein
MSPPITSSTTSASPASAVDQRGLPGQEVGVVEQGLPRRQSGDHRGGSGGMVDTRRQRRKVARIHRHVLRQRAVASHEEVLSVGVCDACRGGLSADDPVIAAPNPLYGASLLTRMPSATSFAASRPGRARRSLIRRQRDLDDIVAW